jgi:hypothetical protein
MKLPSKLLCIYRNLPVVHELIQVREHLAGLQQKLAALQSLQLKEADVCSSARFKDPKRLLLYGFQVSSQNEEDGMLHEIFRRIGTSNKVFAEIGIGDGSENNTAFLLSQGWSGFWIDGAPGFLDVVAGRPDLRGGCVSTKMAFVTKENAAGIFKEAGVPEEFDLLSLDIDQNTYFVWEGLAAFRPRVVVIEYNATLPPDVNWKVNYDSARVADRSHNFGASLKAYELLGKQLGYSLVGCDFLGVNAFFVRDDLVEDKFAAPFTSENHYEPARYALTHRRGHPVSILDRAYNSTER